MGSLAATQEHTVPQFPHFLLSFGDTGRFMLSGLPSPSPQPLPPALHVMALPRPLTSQPAPGHLHPMITTRSPSHTHASCWEAHDMPYLKPGLNKAGLTRPGAAGGGDKLSAREPGASQPPAAAVAAKRSPSRSCREHPPGAGTQLPLGWSTQLQNNSPQTEDSAADTCPTAHPPSTTARRRHPRHAPPQPPASGQGETPSTSVPSGEIPMPPS